MIRPCTESDLPRLIRIYNHYVAHSHATFDIEQETEQTRAGWLAQFDGRRYQCWVASADDRVLGYATSLAFKTRAAYQTSIEVSVYVDPDHKEAGWGRALYHRLFENLENQDVHRAYAVIAVPNPASIALHSLFGFVEVARLNEVGRKFGRFWDVVWMEKRFGN